MGSGRTFLRTLASSVKHVFVQPGEVRYFSIDLSSRYRWYIAPARLVLVALTGIIVVSIFWSAAHTVVTLQSLHDLHTRLDHLRLEGQHLLDEAQREGIDLSEASLRQLPAEVSLANQLLVKRHFSWTQFLSSLEAVIPPHVSIQNIRLDPGSAVVHMTGLAATVEDVTALTVTLQDHAVFHDPVLGQHRVGPDGLVEFDLTLWYRQPEI